MTAPKQYSHRAMQNMTTQLKSQLKFLQDDLAHEKKALEKARSYKKYNLPGTATMIKRHEAGVKKTEADIKALKVRIRLRQKNGQIFKIL